MMNDGVFYNFDYYLKEAHIKSYRYMTRVVVTGNHRLIIISLKINFSLIENNDY